MWRSVSSGSRKNRFRKTHVTREQIVPGGNRSLYTPESETAACFTGLKRISTITGIVIRPRDGLHKAAAVCFPRPKWKSVGNRRLSSLGIFPCDSLCWLSLPYPDQRPDAWQKPPLKWLVEHPLHVAEWPVFSPRPVAGRNALRSPARQAGPTDQSVSSADFAGF